MTNTTNGCTCSECGKVRDNETLAEVCCTMQSPFLPLEPGDFIEIPAWNTYGCVLTSEWDTTGLGTDAALSILLETKPEDPNPRRYRLEPNEYKVIG